jgi:hypothetical protein
MSGADIHQCLPPCNPAGSFVHDDKEERVNRCRLFFQLPPKNASIFRDVVWKPAMQAFGIGSRDSVE